MVTSSRFTGGGGGGGEGEGAGAPQPGKEGGGGGPRPPGPPCVYPVNLVFDLLRSRTSQIFCSCYKHMKGWLNNKGTQYNVL